MPVAITGIYLSKQRVLNIGYERKCLSFYKHSCCKYLIILLARTFCNQWFQDVKYANCSLWLLEANH